MACHCTQWMDGIDFVNKFHIESSPLALLTSKSKNNIIHTFNLDQNATESSLMSTYSSAYTTSMIRGVFTVIFKPNCTPSSRPSWRSFVLNQNEQTAMLWSRDFSTLLFLFYFLQCSITRTKDTLCRDDKEKSVFVIFIVIFHYQ